MFVAFLQADSWYQVLMDLGLWFLVGATLAFATISELSSIVQYAVVVVVVCQCRVSAFDCWQLGVLDNGPQTLPV